MSTGGAHSGSLSSERLRLDAEWDSTGLGIGLIQYLVHFKSDLHSSQVDKYCSGIWGRPSTVNENGKIVQ